MTYEYDEGWVDFERPDGRIYTFRWVMSAGLPPHYAYYAGTDMYERWGIDGLEFA